MLMDDRKPKKAKGAKGKNRGALKKSPAGERRARRMTQHLRVNATLRNQWGPSGRVCLDKRVNKEPQSAGFRTYAWGHL
jgi:hypothetical protein